MKVFETILGVTGITVQSGTTNSTGKPVRDVVITTPDGEVVLHLIGEVREDLQINFAGGEQGSARAPSKTHVAR
jgi:hypothetical protein